MENFKKIFWRIARHHCLIFLVLVILGLIWGSFLFYKNFILIKKRELEVIPSQIQIKKEILEQVLKELEGREKNLKEIESKSYLDPFEEIALTGGEEEGEEEE